MVRQWRQRAGRTPDQDGQGIAGSRELVFETGNGAQRAKVLGLGLLQVELGVLPALEQFFGDFKIALLLSPAPSIITLCLAARRPIT